MNRFVPSNLVVLRRDVLCAASALLEEQVRASQAFSAIAKTLHRVHGELANSLAELAGRADADLTVRQLARRCQTLRTTLALVEQHYQADVVRQRDALRALLAAFNESSKVLAQTLVEKDLLDRHRMVLERVVLSYERVINWLPFIEEVLKEFHAIFPFDLFFVAFAEKHGLTAHLFYPGRPTAAQRSDLEPQLVRELLARLNQPFDAAVDLAVHYLDWTPWFGIATAQCYQLLTEKVPDHRSGLAGILGVGFGTAQPLSAQEQTVIRSLLAILVIVVGSSRALSDTLRQLEYFSMHDPLTHLYNRRHFLHMLEYEIGRSERHQHAFSLIMIDLDDFKEINDTYGHPAGDLALTELANVLQAQVRQGDLACRIGGDEFILLLPETPLEGAKALARKLCDRLRAHRYFYQGTSFHVTCSLGIVSYPQDGKSVHELLAHADLAAYEAKRRGKDEICAYDDLKTRRTGGALTRDSLAEQRSEVEALREALAERRIVPFFQPIVDMASGQVVAFEVLARLIPSVGDPIPAGRFITVIEKYGLGRELDRQIIAAALAALRDFPGEKPTLFLNLSVQEIQNRNVLGFAARLCDQWGLDPGRIVFELLERHAVDDLEKMRQFIRQLRKRGFRFALDDFGSGYNSLHYLRELELDFVKIDGAFVRGMQTSRIDEALVRNLSNLCADLGMQTVAEFVENDEMFAMLQKMGITHAQGYYLGLPLPRLPVVESPPRTGSP